MSKPLLFTALLLVFPIFVEGRETPAISVQELANTTSSWDGNALPAYPEGQPEVRLLRITIAPGARLPWHKHPVINVGYLLEGQLMVRARDGSTFRMEAGDSIVELVDEWHYGMNPGDTPAVILVFYAGVEGTPVTVLQDPEGADED